LEEAQNTVNYVVVRCFPSILVAVQATSWNGYDATSARRQHKKSSVFRDQMGIIDNAELHR
jgi:hypothetical protein